MGRQAAIEACESLWGALRSQDAILKLRDIFHAWFVPLGSYLLNCLVFGVVCGANVCQKWVHRLGSLLVWIDTCERCAESCTAIGLGCFLRVVVCALGGLTSSLLYNGGVEGVPCLHTRCV